MKLPSNFAWQLCESALLLEQQLTVAVETRVVQSYQAIMLSTIKIFHSLQPNF